MTRRRIGALLAAGAVAGLLVGAWPEAPAVAEARAAPPPRYEMGTVEDSARDLAVLFGGMNNNTLLGDTWTWDGTDWIQHTPAHAPSAPYGMGIGDAARGRVVLFGGINNVTSLGDTWTWDGTDWAIPYPANITLVPSSGPPGTVVRIKGSGFGPAEEVPLNFLDSTSGKTKLATVVT